MAEAFGRRRRRSRTALLGLLFSQFLSQLTFYHVKPMASIVPACASYVCKEMSSFLGLGVLGEPLLSENNSENP